MNPVQAQQLWALNLMRTMPVNRGSWQAQKTDLATYEETGVWMDFTVPDSITAWADMCAPDLPWAEEHFLERISGQPMNPAPSYVRWPWHSAAHADDHVNGKVFDHTYPERYWPKLAGDDDDQRVGELPLTGIRFEYGDLRDVINLLRRDPFTRQAVLPIFFPEDTGATSGQRVPCSLSYHFLRVGTRLDVFYTLRSCDLTRHFLNDVYMTGRLLQHVTHHVRGVYDDYPHVGHLKMVIHNLHLFTDDAWRFQ